MVYHGRLYFRNLDISCVGGGVRDGTGLYSAEQYIEVRLNTILKFVAQRPIMELCLEAERKHGTGPRQYWWDQPMDSEG